MKINQIPTDNVDKLSQTFNALDCEKNEAYQKMEESLSKTETKKPYTRNKVFIPVSNILNMEAAEVDWLWEHCIPAGTIAALVGPSDCGKSLLARQLAVSICLQRKEVAGKAIYPRHGRAIYITTEDMDAEWKAKLEKYSLTHDEKRVLGDNMLLVTDYEKVTGLLEEELQNVPTDLVVLDVLSDIFGDDLNSAIAVRKFMNPFKKLARDHGTSFLFVHHISKKGEAQQTASKQNVLGSQGIESSMRSVLELRKNPDSLEERVLRITKGNYVEERIKKFPIRLRLTEELKFECISAATAESEQDILSERVMELHAQNLSVRAIAAQVTNEGKKIGKTTVAEILNRYKQSTVIVNLETGEINPSQLN